jgi:hypothetical protein
MERKNRIPNTRLNRFYDDTDFDLEIDMASELIEGDANFTVVLYRIDRKHSNSSDIYGESNAKDTRFLPPVELKVLLSISEAENKNYGNGGTLRYQEYGNLIIKLNLPSNLYWNENLILIEQSMSLYEMIYGMDICLDLGESKKISIQNWVPSRDGFLVEISNNNKNIESNIILNNYSLAIKLFLNYEDNPEKEGILKQYFS